MLDPIYGTFFRNFRYFGFAVNFARIFVVDLDVLWEVVLEYSRGEKVYGLFFFLWEHETPQFMKINTFWRISLCLDGSLGFFRDIWGFFGMLLGCVGCFMYHLVRRILELFVIIQSSNLMQIKHLLNNLPFSHHYQFAESQR